MIYHLFLQGADGAFHSGTFFCHVATILPTRKLEVSREYIMSEIKGDQELEVGERLVIPLQSGG
jgi:hypothetical protein